MRAAPTRAWALGLGALSVALAGPSPLGGCGTASCREALQEDAGQAASLLQVAAAPRPSALLSAPPVVAGSLGERVTCGIVERVPGVASGISVCRPVGPAEQRWPLFVFGHGDWQPPNEYSGMLMDIASYGFVVAAYRSCIWVVPGNPDYPACDNGRVDYLEALKVIHFFAQDPAANVDLAPVDMSQQVSVGGHSGGGRVALQVAAVRDTPAYLQGTPSAEVLDRDDGALRKAAQRVGAAVALYADDMRDTISNPDVEGFTNSIKTTPVFVITSSDDFGLTNGAGWWDFTNVGTASKIFIDLRDKSMQGHMEPIEVGSDGPWVALFGQAMALGNMTAKRLLYGDCPECLRNARPHAMPKARNTGAGKVGILLCDGATAWPEEDASFCSATASV